MTHCSACLASSYSYLCQQTKRDKSPALSVDAFSPTTSTFKDPAKYGDPAGGSKHSRHRSCRSRQVGSDQAAAGQIFHRRVQGLLPPQRPDGSQQQVWRTLQRILSSVLGIPPYKHLDFLSSLIPHNPSNSQVLQGLQSQMNLSQALIESDMIDTSGW